MAPEDVVWGLPVDTLIVHRDVMEPHPPAPTAEEQAPLGRLFLLLLAAACAMLDATSAKRRVPYSWYVPEWEGSAEEETPR